MQDPLLVHIAEKARLKYKVYDAPSAREQSSILFLPVMATPDEQNLRLEDAASAARPRPRGINSRGRFDVDACGVSVNRALI